MADIRNTTQAWEPYTTYDDVTWERVVPRGTLSLTIDGRRADVWPIGITLEGYTARWSAAALEPFRYIGAGYATDLDGACEAALAVLTDPASR